MRVSHHWFHAAGAQAAGTEFDMEAVYKTWLQIHILAGFGRHHTFTAIIDHHGAAPAVMTKMSHTKGKQSNEDVRNLSCSRKSDKGFTEERIPV